MQTESLIEAADERGSEAPGKGIKLTANAVQPFNPRDIIRRSYRFDMREKSRTNNCHCSLKRRQTSASLPSVTICCNRRLALPVDQHARATQSSVGQLIAVSSMSVLLTRGGANAAWLVRLEAEPAPLTSGLLLTDPLRSCQLCQSSFFIRRGLCWP